MHPVIWVQACCVPVLAPVLGLLGPGMQLQAGQAQQEAAQPDMRCEMPPPTIQAEMAEHRFAFTLQVALLPSASCAAGL